MLVRINLLNFNLLFIKVFMNDYLFFLLVIYFLFKDLHFMKIRLKIRGYKTRIQNIKNFYKHEKSYILNCYQHSQNDKKFISRLEKAGLLEDSESKDYLPIFLAHIYENNLTHV